MPKRFLLLVLFVLPWLGGCKKYNALVEKNATCDEKWADLAVELQRRYDLIPNIVNTVKEAEHHEEKTLEEVTAARASATQSKLTGDDFSDPAKLAAFPAAQDKLSGSQSRQLVTQAAY